MIKEGVWKAMNNKTVLVVGGGAAGMMAALLASGYGISETTTNKVILIEKNEKLGKKIYITGKGRCNVTNACSVEELFEKVVSNPKFLYSAFYTCTNQNVMDLFEQLGLSLKVERGNRVFPQSDHASDVIKVLENELRKRNVTIMLHTKVQELLLKEEHVTGVRLSNQKELLADAVIVCTGGLSYASTGSTGDGYRFAKQANLTVVEQSPSLVPFEIKENWCKEVMGLSLRNTGVSIYDGIKKIYDDFGEVLFTHFGVSGPTIISASAYIQSRLKKEKELMLYLDLKPALSEEALDARVLRDFQKNQNRQLKNSLDALLPKSLIPVVIMLSGVSGDILIHDVTKEQRRTLVSLLKKLPLTIIGTRGYQEAIITKGGVSVKEIDPGTMESKKVKGLYFAGEVLDLDAVTGGYNLQIAWSTGYVAGMAQMN